MNLLLIDNYDSYTYNLFHLMAQVAGVEPGVVSNDQVGARDLARMELDAVVISPGPGHPGRERDFGICGEAIALGLPVLGVCLGHQGLAAAYGGRVIAAEEPMHGRMSRVRHHGTGLFHSIPQDFAAIRYHSLIVAAELPPCLEVTAWTGDGIIMGLRHRERTQFGVQFHPESIGTEYGAHIMSNFLSIVENRARARRPHANKAMRRQMEAPAGQREQRAKRSSVGTPVNYRRLSGELAAHATAEQVFATLYGNEPYAYWLDSAVARDALSRFSFMGAPTRAGDRIIRYQAHERVLSIECDGAVERTGESLFSWLDRELARDERANLNLPFMLQGGYVGYLGYEVGDECCAMGCARRAGALPDAVLLDCQRYLVFDHLDRAIYAVTMEVDIGLAERWFEEIEARLAEIALNPLTGIDGLGEPPRRDAPLEFRLARSRGRYLDDIRACLSEIRRGESYEVCLTNRIIGPPIERPLDAYRVLRARNPAPFAAYLRLDDSAVLSCSPELFLRIDATGQVMSKPIKGTCPRGASPAEDEAARRHLAASMKDQAENLMIVDLLRNDLGRVCEVGSVAVPRMMAVESFATVHQLVSTVTGQLRADRSAIDCVRAAFPGGSMTGAPKLRTMEIITALEREPRGVYSGCIGYLSANGAVELGMTIRTAVATRADTSIGVGGAIVALSDPDAEVAEMLLKGAAMMDGISSAESGRTDGWFVLDDSSD